MRLCGKVFLNFFFKEIETRYHLDVFTLNAEVKSKQISDLLHPFLIHFAVFSTERKRERERESERERERETDRQRVDSRHIINGLHR